MNKKEILESIVHELKREFATLVSSAMEAKDAATNEESKAENKYDTRGLEASYLAGAQAERAQLVRRIISTFEGLDLVQYNKNQAIGSTALVQLQVTSESDEEKKWFFLLPLRGGLRVLVEKDEVMTLSLDSPLGGMLINKKIGDSFSHAVKGLRREYEVLDLF